MVSSLDLKTGASTLIGREAVLDRLVDALLASNGPTVVIVHGEAGIGKSALAQAVSSAWSVHGNETRALDGEWRTTGQRGAADGAPCLWLLDSSEETLDLSTEDWASLLKLLRPGDRILLVARQTVASHPLPDSELLDLRLPALSDVSAVAVLSLLGVAEAARAGLADWARGVPLLLVLGAQYSHDHPDWDPVHGVAPAQLGSRLLGRLSLGTESPAYAAFLAAAIAPSVDRALLAEICGGAHPDIVFDELADSTLVEAAGDRLTLHLAARRALITSVSAAEPEALSDLRCRIADHLFADRARRGVAVAVDLAQLTTSGKMALGFRAHEGFHTRTARHSDAEQMAAAFAEAGRTPWWTSIEPYVIEAPERVRVTVGPDGALLAYCIVMTPDNAPPCSFEDPIFRPWIEHAAATDRNALLWRDTADLRHLGDGPALTTAQATAHAAAVTTCGLTNPGRIYAPVRRPVGITLSILRTMRATHLADLDGSVGNDDVSCQLLDLGAQGLLGVLRGLVYFEAGRGGSPFEAALKPRREVYEDALRNYQRPAVLARSPLAVGASNSERVISVRALIDDAIAASFGASQSEEALREVLVSAYISPNTGGHERAALDLNMSRTTYFRKLRVAVALVLDVLAG